MRSYIVPSSSNDPFQHKGTSECGHNASVRALVVNCAVPDLHQTRPLLHHVDEALAEALVVCRNMREPPAFQARASLPPHLGRGITPVDCDGNAELPHARRRVHVQKINTPWNDKGLREILWQTLGAGATWSAATRIHELSDVSVDYCWLWQLNLHHCSVWDEDKFCPLSTW